MSIATTISQTPINRIISPITKTKFIPFTAIFIFAFILWHKSLPNGLSQQTWNLFVIFISTILAIIIKPLPMGSIAILALSACSITKTLTINQTLSSFSSKTVWLVLAAFLLARAFIKTGLGARLAYYFVYIFGKNTFGLSYALVITDLILAPFIPSNTARGAGIVYPIVSALNYEAKSYLPQESTNSFGKYLLLVCFHTNIITSAMFLTAMAANPLIVAFAGELGVTITWFSWFKAAIIPGTISLILLPIVLFFIASPKVIKTPKAPAFAKNKLAAMGNLNVKEIVMILTFALLLILWVAGPKLAIDATTAALVGLSILLISGVIDLDDILSEKGGWNAFIWLATLLTLTSHLDKFGFFSWLGSIIHTNIIGLDYKTAFLIVILVYFYSHYLFASLIAHITTMYTTFLLILKMVGAPLITSAYLLAFLSSLCACLTHYSTGTAPIYFGNDNRFSVKQWWKVGAVIAICHILVWLFIGEKILSNIDL